MAAARKLLGDEALRSVQKLVELRDQKVEIGAALKAAQHILKLAGMEVEQVSHSGEVTFTPWKITREDVD